MTSSTLSGLINNAALLMAMCLLYDVLFLRKPARKPLNQIFIGIILGSIGIGVMLNPWVFLPGVIFDTRSVLLSITGFFFGLIPTVTAILITAGYRIFLGGAGVWMGVAVIATSAGAGLGWRYLRKKGVEDVSTLELYALGLLTHFLMLAWTFALPNTFALGVLSKISLPVILIFPALTVLLGKLMLNHHERTNMVKTIQDSEEKYRELVENANSIILKWNRDGRILFMNEYGLKFFGYTPGEIFGKSAIGTIVPDTEAGGRDLPKLMKDIFETPERYEKNLNENIRKDGSRAWVAWTNRPIYNEEGVVTGMFSVGTDNTERIRAENALIESEKKWRNVLINTPQIWISLDIKGRITFANDHFLKLTGWRENEITGRDWFNTFIPEDLRREARNIFDTAISQKDTLEFPSYENQILTRNGERRSVAWSNVLTRDVHGNVVDATCLGVDLTDRKQSVELLHENAEYHQELFENSPTALYLQDFSKVETRIKQLANIENLNNYLQDHPEEVLQLSKSVVISKVNKSAVDLYGADSTEALVKNFSQILIENDWQHFIDQIVDFTSGIDRYEGEARNKTIHGETIDLIIRKKVLSREKNGLSKILVSLTDITSLLQAYREREKLKSRLQQAQKMEAIGNLAGGIAHDFNNILFPIMGLSELLLEDLPPGSPEHGHVQKIFKASKRGSDLVKQILAFGRQSDTNMMPVSIQQVLAEVIKLSRSTIPSNIDITHDIQIDCGRVMAAPTQLHQIAMNLITNAYHAVEAEGGNISIHLKEIELGDETVAGLSIKTGRYAMLSVSDTGYGIDPAIMDKIFEPYFTTKGIGKGTGLGLSTVYGIVKEREGAIKVYSALGKGTVFNVMLPLINESAEDADVKIAENLDPGTERILLVDDEESIVGLLKEMLERLGYRVTCRTSSVEALKVFESDPDGYELVVTDMTMPDLTGDQLARKVKSIRPGIPVIICTGFSERVKTENAGSIGINGLLMKPVGKSDLAEMVRRVLDEAKASR